MKSRICFRRSLRGMKNGITGSCFTIRKTRILLILFIEAEEPWEIPVAKKTLDRPKAWMFAACLNEKVIGLLYGHISERACGV